jgi:hypothetical protein
MFVCLLPIRHTNSPFARPPGAKPAPEFIMVLSAAPGFAYTVQAVVRLIIFSMHSLP